jgi:hypothetical protein
VLELARLRVIRVLQDEESGDFYIAHREGALLADARRARATSDADSNGEAEEQSPPPPPEGGDPDGTT